MSLPTDPADNLATLIRCPSVTPTEGGALSALEEMLKPLGFAVDRPAFSEDGTADVENLYARLSGNGPHLMFAGHTDVVPPGDENAWSHPPFAAAIADGRMYGRGAVDMKGGIACFVAAVARHIEAGGRPKGSISLLITGDEEGPSINGSVKLLDWAAGKGERWDGAIVGEPTNPQVLGDMIKVGRRGSVTGDVVVHGRQGHAAYPHLADNPVRGLMSLLDALLRPAFDKGTENFQPTNLEITTIDVGNPALNVIPARATAAFNIRFSDAWDAETLQAEIHNRLDRAAESHECDGRGVRAAHVDQRVEGAGVGAGDGDLAAPEAGDDLLQVARQKRSGHPEEGVHADQEHPAVGAQRAHHLEAPQRDGSSGRRGSRRLGSARLGAARRGHRVSSRKADSRSVAGAKDTRPAWCSASSPGIS